MLGGSDDHAGVDIGRTYTEAPPASTPAEFLAHVRARNVIAGGAQGSAAKWAHAAIALAARALGLGRGAGQAPDPLAVGTMARRLLAEADVRHGAGGSDAGVSFRTVHSPGRGLTYSVVSNTSTGAWPVARQLDEFLATTGASE